MDYIYADFAYFFLVWRIEFFDFLQGFKSVFVLKLCKLAQGFVFKAVGVRFCEEIRGFPASKRSGKPYKECLCFAVWSLCVLLCRRLEHLLIARYARKIYKQPLRRLNFLALQSREKLGNLHEYIGILRLRRIQCLQSRNLVVAWTVFNDIQKRIGNTRRIEVFGSHQKHFLFIFALGFFCEVGKLQKLSACPDFAYVLGKDGLFSVAWKERSKRRKLFKVLFASHSRRRKGNRFGKRGRFRV